MLLGVNPGGHPRHGLRTTASRRTPRIPRNKRGCGGLYSCLRSSGMADNLFELSAEYDAMLLQGIRLSGESADFFVRGRVDDLAPRIDKPARILDFGCGIGRAADYLAKIFPDARVVGADTADNAIRHAADRYGSSRR